MNRMRKLSANTVLAAVVLAVLSITASAQQVKRTPFDVTNYVMDVTLMPTEKRINATVDVTFTPLENTRSITFELNGSLKVESITRLGAPPASPTTRSATKPAAPGNLSYVQDQAGVADIGPNVRIDLGADVVSGTPLTLRFKYSGILELPQGGPLLSKRLAYIGYNYGYLMYASRWFPFHDYAADLATSDITISIPSNQTLVGYSDLPVVANAGKYRFVQSKPTLVGNFAYGTFQTKTLRYGDYELNFYTRGANDQLIARYGETLGKALNYYTKRFGSPETAKRLNIVQIDDDSLDFYSAQGMLFIANRPFEEGRDVVEDRLEREAAFQWWGLTVGLKSFDDAWLSQGLAEYSAVSLRESEAADARLEDIHRELLEKSLTFEQTSSLLLAPGSLDDQSVAYQYIMYGKGAFVFKLLRTTLGPEKFEQLLKTYLQEFRGKSASVDDFEKLTTRIAGQNMRYFFARWYEGTGVPEFTADYLILRTKGGKFVTRGTIKQNYDNLRLPVELQLKSEGDEQAKVATVQVDEATADFNIESSGKPLGLNIDPNYKLLRISPDLRVSSIARRGIEQFKEGNYAEAQTQFEQALKLDRSNAWIYYHLGLLFLEQRNYDLAIDNFKAARDLGNQGAARPAWLHVWSEIKMGNAYDAKGDRTRANGAYKRAETIGDNYDNAQDAVKRFQASPFDPKAKDTSASK